MFDNSEYYIDDVRDDIERLQELGYSVQESAEILKVAELRVLTSCVKDNPYNHLNEFKVSGWVQVED